MQHHFASLHNVCVIYKQQSTNINISLLTIFYDEGFVKRSPQPSPIDSDRRNEISLETACLINLHLKWSDEGFYTYETKKVIT